MFKKRQKIYLVIKRIIDLAGSILGILILSPLLLIIAIITKISSKGPVLFKQERLGKDEKVFILLKFRSMKVDAVQIGAESISIEEQEAMMTKWGKFMRKTSLDEFPQLFNILTGKMSFIGPRPEMIGATDDLRKARQNMNPSPYSVKPGLGGYAQIYLRRNHDPIKKAEYDSYYVKHFSFWLDIKLFLMSFLVLFGLYKGH